MIDLNEVVDRKFDVIDTLTVAPYGKRYRHLLDRCPAVVRALARDGRVLRSVMTKSEIVASDVPMCGVCELWSRQ